MSVLEILQSLSEQGAQFWLEGEKLRYRAPKGVLTPEAGSLLTQNRDEVISLVRSHPELGRTESPLSYAQQSLWFLHQAAPESAAYNVAFAMRILSGLDVPVLRRAFQAFVDRHPSLRTTFSARGGRPVQYIYASRELAFEEIDASGWSTNELHVRVAADNRIPYDLESGPLFRVRLYRRSERDSVVMVSAHHIVMDGWSVWLTLEELRNLYSALLRNQSLPAPAAPAQYTDYIHWQKETLEGPRGEDLWNYWQKQLAGDLPELNLPTDRVRPTFHTFNGATRNFQLTEELTLRIRDLARREGVTLFAFLLAAYQVLLHRYSGQDEVLVGSPMSGRTRPEFAGIVGCFVNPIVLRGRLAGDPTFRDFLRQTRQTTLDALEHQEYPLPLLAERLRPNRDFSRSTLFQVDFVFHKPQQGGDISALLGVDMESRRSTLGDLEIESFYVPQQEGQLDLSLEMWMGGKALCGSLKYNTDPFDASTIERMTGHLHALLDSIAADPDQRVSALSLLSEAEQSRMRAFGTGPRLDYPREILLHHQIALQAQRAPAAVAVVDRDRSLTYHELDSRSNRLARVLIRRGVGRETPVGLCLNRSLEAAVGLLAVLKAGGAYVPLNPDYPRERLQQIADEARFSVLLTTQSLAEEWIDRVPHVLCLDSDSAETGREEDSDPAVPVQPEHVAYIIFTSGSTGKPKGVLVTHGGLMNAFRAWEDAYDLRSVRSHLQMASLSFDVFTGDLARALGSGAKLVLCPQEYLLAPEKLYDLMRSEDVDCAEFVPAVLRQLMQYLDKSGRSLDFMRLLIAGSDSWNVQEYQQVLRCIGLQTRLINSYGVTEATIDSTYFEGTADRLPASGLVPIGKPFAHTQILILDARLQPVPIGVAGELCIGGPGLAREYLNRPDLTCEKFIPNPFGAEPSDRIYRTGDLARYRADGNIELLGRMDQQVKIRGFRIELGEIESALSAHPAIKEAVVVAREIHPGDKRLVAYTVNREREPAAVGDLRSFLKKNLPEFMIPSYFVSLVDFPLLSNGKIDRKALPAPVESVQPAADFVPPQTETEIAVAEIWKELLSLRQVGLHDHFFERGGHSLLATQLVSRLRETFQIEIPLRTIFEATTVAAMAERIDTLRWFSRPREQSISIFEERERLVL